MTNIPLKEQLNLLPDMPGVYFMLDKNGEIIYVGKAKILKNRVRSYFNKNHDSPKLRVMVPQIVSFKYIVTDTEVEALILESHMIKKHKPKYNVLLKDDKKFPWFLITDEDYPRIIVTRRANKNMAKGRYYGPYTNSRAMYSTLELIKKIFPLKQCKTPRFKDRPCIYYQIGKCLGPCQKLVSSEEYKALVKQVEMFLSGNQGELLEQLKHQMEVYAEKQQYEKAARYRDSYFDVKKVMERQKVVSENTNIFQDIIGFYRESNRLCFVVMKIRHGRLIDKQDFDYEISPENTTEEYSERFLKDYYISTDDIASEIFLPLEISEEEKDLISRWLKIKKGKKVDVAVPKIGRKKEMIDLANKNASISFDRLKLALSTQMVDEWNEVGAYIQEKLKLKNFPHTIECFDISHIQGTNTVASMVYFENGRPKKSMYKRFKIRTLKDTQVDDFQSMREVIRRRYSRLKKENLPMPDLIIIDGGKGQLSSAVGVLEELGGISSDIVSLAKREEEVFLPHQKNSILFPLNSKALFLFQKVRDEAHRFAITYHRKLRSKTAVESSLDEIPGVSEKKKKQLFERFETIEGILAANKEELQDMFGLKTGEKIFDALQNL